MPIAQINSAEIYYRIDGSGPPLLLIAGLGANAEAWGAALPFLRAHFTCIVYDSRGTGRSSVTPGPYSIDQLADDAVALVRSLDMAPLAAVGWSLGGSVLQSALIRHGDVFTHAVLLNTFPNYTPLQHAWLDCILALRDTGTDRAAQLAFALGWTMSPGFLADHAQVMQRAGLIAAAPNATTNAGYRAQGEAVRVYDSRADLPRITTPTLVLCGAQDVLTPPAQSEEIARLIPGAVLRELPQGAHVMAQEFPRETAQAIIDYLKQ